MLNSTARFTTRCPESRDNDEHLSDSEHNKTYGSSLHTRPNTMVYGMDIVTYGDHRFIPRRVIPKRL